MLQLLKERRSILKFIADAMLGRLARWLRLLGYDTAYDAAIPDRTLTSRSLRERRVILTRDNGVSRHRAFWVVRIQSDRVQDQLRQVIVELGLKEGEARPFTRCSECNACLEAIAKEKVKKDVPPGVHNRQNEFWQCPRCRKIYWEGTHWNRLLRCWEDVWGDSGREKK